MAIYKTRTELKNFELTNGKTVDLLALIGTYRQTRPQLDWVAPATAPEIGTVAYVDAMGDMRRGVVVKTTKTKVHVAVTTQGAVDSAMRLGYSTPVRVQIVIADTNYVRVAPPAPVAEPEITLDEAADLILDATSELARTLVETDHAEALTLDSQDGKVDNMNNDENAEEFTEAERAELAEDFKTSGALDDAHAEALTEAPAAVRETTGSAVVKLLERVLDRIRQNHPEVPQIIMVTGAGIGNGSNKWGHFRPNGWTAREEGRSAPTIHEMFMAGETLAKGGRQVLQTMLHESAHALAEKRGEKDTSRQGRWHNKTFLKFANELGLEFRGQTADSSIGYSQVVLTDETVAEYADLLAELDTEIHLMVRLPGWLGGDAGEDGGEGIGKAPKTTEPSNGGSLKLTCLCEEPNIIRASKKVAEKLVVNCGECDELFRER